MECACEYMNPKCKIYNVKHACILKSNMGEKANNTDCVASIYKGTHPETKTDHYEYDIFIAENCPLFTSDKNGSVLGKLENLLRFKDELGRKI